MFHFTSLVIEKLQFNQFPIISHGNQTKRQVTIILAMFNPPTQTIFLPN